MATQAQSVATLSANNPDVLEGTANAFAETTHGFLQALQTVWPQCPNLNQLITDFESTVNGPIEALRRTLRIELIKTFHHHFEPLYTRVRAHDSTIFTEVQLPDMLKRINIHEKWAEASPSTRSTIFAWVDELCNAAELYGFYEMVPPTLLTKLTGVALEVAANSENGGGVDPTAIEKMMVGMPQEEMEEFAKTMMESPSKIQALLGVVGRMQGGGAAGTAPAGSFDASSLMQAMGGGGAGGLMGMIQGLGGGH